MDILTRIQKLLNNSRNNPSKEEASTAAALAAELMFKYQIGEDDLDVEHTERGPEPVQEGIVHEENKTRRDVWKSSLANTVARSFGCRCYFSTGNGFKLHIVGTKSAVQTVQYMFQYLQLEIGRLCEEAWTENKNKGEHGKTWKNSFRLGAVAEVQRRLVDQMSVQDKIVKEREVSGSTAIALYRADQERVNKEYERISRVHNLRAAPGGRANSYNAYSHGRSAGRDVSLGGNGKALGASKERLGG